MPNKKRRRIALTVLLTAVVGAGSVIVWEMYKPRNDPKLLGKVTPELKLIPRSQFQAKPWISIPWFGGSKVQFPPEGKMPAKWKDDPLASGILIWDDGSAPSTPASAGTPAVPSMGGMFGMFVAVVMVWKTDGGEVLKMPFNVFQINTDKSYFDVPYVFGEKPIQCSVAMPTHIGPIPPGVAPPAFRIELPPLRKPAPKQEVVKIKQGDIEFTFTPKRWIGPSFVSDYSVTATGLKPNEHAFIGSDLNSAMGMLQGSDTESHSPVWCRVSPGKTSTISIASSTFETSVVIVEPQKAKIRVAKSASPSFPSGSGFTELEYKDSAGKVFAKGFFMAATGGAAGSGSVQPEPTAADNGLVAAQISDRWIGYAYELQSSDAYSVAQGSQMTPHKPGIYDAILYRSKRTFTLKVGGLRPSTAELKAYVTKK